jgi:hypothetical protein
MFTFATAAYNLICIRNIMGAARHRSLNSTDATFSQP